jgi:hypothetical protein
MCFIRPVVKNLENPFVLAVDTPSSTSLTTNLFTSRVDAFCLDALLVESWDTHEEVEDVLNTHLLVITLLSMAVRTDRHQIVPFIASPSKQWRYMIHLVSVIQ